MIRATVKKYIITLFVGIVAFAAADELRASSPLKIDTVKTHLVIPRPAIDPVKPLYRSAADPVDTLDTAHEFVKVILYGDNTWQYYKTPEYQTTADVYAENWKNTTGFFNPSSIIS